MYIMINVYSMILTARGQVLDEELKPIDLCHVDID